MTRVLKSCESHNLTLLFLRRATRVMWALESQITEHRLYLQCSFVNIAFSLEKYNGSQNGFPHHMWIHNHLWTQDSFYLRKHKESEPKECGRIPARRIFCGKRPGMWKRSTASYVNLQSHWTQDAFYLRKHKESGRVAAIRVFLEKRYGILGGWRERHVNLQVVPGRAGGGSFRRKKNYIAKKEFAYRMCARRPTSAMPKPCLCCERAFCCSMVVMWPVLMHVMSFDVVVMSFDAMWLLVLCHVTWCNAMSCDVPCNGHVVCSKWFCDNAVIQSTILYYKVLLCTTKYYSSTTLYYTVLQRTTSVLLCTTKYYSSTTLYCKVLLQYYSSTTPVLLCTTKCYPSTTLYYKVLLQYYSVLHSTTTLLQYYPVLQSTTLVLLCTAKYYSSTTLYYKVLLQYYSVLHSTTTYYSSTTLYYKVLLQYYSVLQSSIHDWSLTHMNRYLHDWCPSHMKRHLQCAEQQESSSNFTKYCTCHAKWLWWLIHITYETSFTMRGATGVILQLHQILRLPRKMNLMIDPRHIWNVIYNARSNKLHTTTSPNTAPATQNESHDWSASHMKRHLQCAEQAKSPSNLTKYCACHEICKFKISAETPWSASANRKAIRG